MSEAQYGTLMSKITYREAFVISKCSKGAAKTKKDSGVVLNPK
jgi:hypothetical protein